MRALATAMLGVAVATAPASAQRAPKYDPAAEVTVTGVVADYHESKQRSDHPGLHFILEIAAAPEDETDSHLLSPWRGHWGRDCCRRPPWSHCRGRGTGQRSPTSPWSGLVVAGLARRKTNDARPPRAGAVSTLLSSGYGATRSSATPSSSRPS